MYSLVAVKMTKPKGGNEKKNLKRLHVIAIVKFQL